MKNYLRVSVQSLMGLPIVGAIALAGMPHAIASPLFVEKSFTGLSFDDGPVIPPDSNGAVGQHHLVQVTNRGFAIYDKASGQVLKKTSLDQFWRSMGLPAAKATNNFDPRIIYDPMSQRWFTVAADRTDVAGNVANFPLGNRVVLAVSQTADPTQGWQGFALPASSAVQPLFADAPNLGIDADGIYISANMFDRTLQNATSTIFAVAKSDIFNATVGSLEFTSIVDVANSRYGSSLMPVTDFSNPADGRADLLTAFGGNQLRRSTLTLPNLLDPPQLIAVADFSRSPNALQPNGSQRLETGDPRFSSAVVRVGNSIWAVHTVADAGGNRAVFRWYELDALTNQVKQQGEIGDGAHDYFYPSIALNSTGGIVIGFNRSGADEFVSSYAIGGTTVGGITTFGVPVLLKAGKDNYFRDFGFGRNRWGDSSSTVFDPSDPMSFWTFQQVADGENKWSTQITQIRLPIARTPESSALLSLLCGAILGATVTMRRAE